MEARHEIIPFDRDSPVRLFMHKLGDVSLHRHESLELLFVLVGEVTVLAGNEQTALSQGDMLLINSNVIHELHSKECVLIAVQIKLSKFDLPPDLVQNLYFDCNSRTVLAQDVFRNIKRVIASMLQVSAAGDEAALLRNRSLAYELLLELVQNFKTAKPAAEVNTHKHLERLSNILRYIDEHYQEQLTLSQLAEREHLSAPYLSSFFEKYMGINFSTYYTNIRLERAIRDLLYTDIPVEQVALDSGFSDPRAFVRAFKKRYNMVPSAYRKLASAPAAQTPEDPLLAINYLDFEPENYFHILYEYLPGAGETPVRARRNEVRPLPVGEVDCTHTERTLRHSWRTVVGVGRAKELLYSEVQDMLRQLQRDVGFRYLRFHGIFSDDMLVCRTGRDGALQFSFTLVDKALDFILSIGLKPQIQFSFMPAAMAAEPDRTVFASPFTISLPRRMEEWNRLVTLFLTHVQKRYGTQEIRSWLYSVWNEPDTSRQMFGFEDRQQFFTLYEATCRTVKEFDSELVFGAPSLFPITKENYKWMRDYLSFADVHGCRPEFIDVHYYSDDFHQLPPGVSTFTAPATANGDPDHFGKFITELHDFLEQESVGHLPVYITEWNLTVSHRSLINDTCFKGCYLVKNFLENYDRVDAVGYWCLTDFLEEYQPAQHLFHGGMGLFTVNGIKKAPYYAMEMLSRLGDTLVAAGEGYFVTRRGERMVMVFYHYEHFNPLFVQEGFGLSLTSRDGVFPNGCDLEVSLTLTHLPDGLYRVRETILNRQHGSCFDRWVDMGAPELGESEAEWLRQNSQPALRIYQTTATQEALSYSATLAPHEVRLVEVSPAGSGYQTL